MKYADDDDELFEEDLAEGEESGYGSKKKLEDDVDNGDMDAEDALSLEGYHDDED